MRVCLVTHQVTKSRQHNIERMRAAVRRAARKGADLVLFGEAAVTGLVNKDVPRQDLSLGAEIPGPQVSEFVGLAEGHQIYIAFGLLERQNGELYDSALLLDRRGEIALHYRRFTGGWHGEEADPTIYKEGNELPTYDAPWGNLAFLICGDLFSERIVDLVKRKKPDWVLVPMARCFGDGSYDSERWYEQEVPAYARRVRQLGATTLIVNYLAEEKLQGGAFGGSLVISEEGAVIDDFPPGKPGSLMVEI